LDPKEPRSRSPSLLDADAHEVPKPSSSERILSGLQGDPSRAARRGRPRRWLWPSALLLVGLAAALMLMFGGAFDGAGTASTRAAAPADPSADPAAPVPAGAEGGGVADAAHDAAVILPGQATSAASATAAVPAPAASSSKDAVALSEIFTPPSERKRVALRRPAAQRAGGSSGDSDVALLTALIQHVEVGDPAARKQLERIPHVQKPADPPDSIEARMQACPAANTEAGLRCRQRLCAGHSGESAACPAASSGGA